ANNWFSNARGAVLSDSKRDNFGGTAGGPVYIPGAYNGKNKTFFFMDFDRVKSMSATSSTASVPTAQQLAVDFSDTRLNNGALIPIFDPFSTFVDSNGNTLRNLIPGNIIPGSRQNKVVQAMDKYFPAPNQPGDPFTRVNNWFAQGVTPSAANKLDAKIDHNISEKQRISSRYGVNWGWNGVANLTGNISHNGNPGFNRNQNFIIDYTRTHNPTTVYAARPGFLRPKSVRDPLSMGFDAVKELGLNPQFQTAGVFAFPAYNTGYRAMGAGGYAIIHRFED